MTHEDNTMGPGPELHTTARSIHSRPFQAIVYGSNPWNRNDWNLGTGTTGTIGTGTTGTNRNAERLEPWNRNDWNDWNLWNPGTDKLQKRTTSTESLTDSGTVSFRSHVRISVDTSSTVRQDRSSSSAPASSEPHPADLLRPRL